ncbi:MAG: hypothetical protein M1834_002488 [Cirrosporium novae-zelandiae]|nr:MAG: hypothetical protein M1834_002488 [Cirrosporium novae-zelandiae]
MVSHRSTLLYISDPCPVSSVPLGTLTTNLQYPSTDALTPSECKIHLQPPTDYTISLDKNITTLSTKSMSSLFAASACSKLLSCFHSTSNTNRFSLVSGEGRTYSLRNPRRLFRRLYASDAVKAYFEECRNDDLKRVYFVVGCETLIDTRFYEREGRSSKTEAKAKVKVDALPGDLGTVGFEAGGEESASRVECKEAVGERIYVIRFRKVRWRRRGGPYLKPLGWWENVLWGLGRRG